MANFDSDSWEFTQRMIRIGHNRRVKKYFKDIASDTRARTGREAIKTALLVRDDDSAIEVMNKMLYFSNYLDRDLVNALPDGWQIKKGQNIPQLVIVFRDANPKSKSGNYVLNIPHHNGTKNIRISNYEKGDYWARWTLKDNSHLIVNARTEAESIRVIKRLEKYVDRKFQTDEKPWLVTGHVSKGSYKQFKAVPIRADWYPEGKVDNQPLWRVYL